jgi:hypothetical protein
MSMVVGRGPGFEAECRRSCRPPVGAAGRYARHADVRPVGSQSDPQRRLLEQVTSAVAPRPIGPKYLQEAEV